MNRLSYFLLLVLATTCVSRLPPDPPPTPDAAPAPDAALVDAAIAAPWKLVHAPKQAIKGLHYAATPVDFEVTAGVLAELNELCPETVCEGEHEWEFERLTCAVSCELTFVAWLGGGRGERCVEPRKGSVRFRAPDSAGRNTADWFERIAVVLRKWTLGREEAERNAAAVASNGLNTFAIDPARAAAASLQSDATLQDEVVAGIVVGTEVVGVRPESLWFFAGIRSGDIVRSVDGYALEGSAFIERFQAAKRGETLVIALQRSGTFRTLVWTFEASFGDVPNKPVESVPSDLGVFKSGPFDWTLDLARIAPGLAALESTVGLVPHYVGGRCVGVELVDVAPSSLWRAIGFRAQDIVKVVGGVAVDSPANAALIIERLRAARPGEKLVVVTERRSHVRTLTWTFKSFPATQ